MSRLKVQVVLCCLLTPCVLRAQAAPGPSIVQPGAPGAPTKVLPADTHAVAPQATAADIAFMQGMIMHHGQAVEMTALIPTHTSNAEVQSIGRRISLSQTDEMRFMRAWLTERGQPTTMSMLGMPGMAMDTLMPGMLSPAQMTALRAAHGAQFDRLFLAGMMQHHGGALTMVKDLFATAGAGQDADLFNFATDVDNTQRAEIRIMQTMLDHLDAKPSKAVPQEKQ